MATTRLEMIFLNQLGRTSKVSIEDPRPDVTEAEVQLAMQNMITKNIFNTAGGDLTGISSARVVTTDVSELIAEQE